MKTIKVAEATKRQLDWLVAKCEALPVSIHNTGAIYLIDTPWADKSRVKWLAEFGPTRHWAQGGPVIERGEISVQHTGDAAKWRAHVWNDGRLDFWPVVYGPTALIAAMRCYVTSKLGETAEVPEELT